MGRTIRTVQELLDHHDVNTTMMDIRAVFPGCSRGAIRRVASGTRLQVHTAGLAGRP